MSRRLRMTISVVVVILIAVTVYQLYGGQAFRSQPPAVTPNTGETAPVSPQQSATVPVVPVHPQVSAGDEPPLGQYPYYIGINDKQCVTIYRWDNGALVLVSETSLSVEELRQEEKQALGGYVGVASEEEAWQRVEGLSH